MCAMRDYLRQVPACHRKNPSLSIFVIEHALSVDGDGQGVAHRVRHYH